MNNRTKRLYIVVPLLWVVVLGAAAWMAYVRSPKEPGGVEEEEEGQKAPAAAPQSLAPRGADGRDLAAGIEMPAWGMSVPPARGKGGVPPTWRGSAASVVPRRLDRRACGAIARSESGTRVGFPVPPGWKPGSSGVSSRQDAARTTGGSGGTTGERWGPVVPARARTWLLVISSGAFWPDEREEPFRGASQVHLLASLSRPAGSRALVALARVATAARSQGCRSYDRGPWGGARAAHVKQGRLVPALLWFRHNACLY